jgi:hypothetical protein
VVTKSGIHLANGSQDIARVISMGCGHYLALEVQADYLATCPGERYVRLWARADSQTDEIVRRWIQQGVNFDHIIPWNEPNIESPTMGYGNIAAKFLEVKHAIDGLAAGDPAIVHWPALAPTKLYRELAGDWIHAANQADIVDVHAYGSAAQILEIVDWYHSVLPDKELLVTECNPGAGNRFDQQWWAQEYLKLITEANKRPWLRGCIGFIWEWHNPDVSLPTTVNWKDQPIEAAVREFNLSNISNSSGGSGEPMSIAVAICPSNQIQNVSPINPAYNEKGGMDYLARILESTMKNAGINARAFIGDADRGTDLTNLRVQQNAAANWIVGQNAAAKLTLNLHTDSGTTSHTFGIFAPRTGEASQRCADVISEAVQRVLGTSTRQVFSKLGTVEYNEYLFATLAKSTAMLIELRTHTVKSDMDALYAKPVLLAEAITQAVLLLGGGAGQVVGTDPTPTIADLQAQLKAANERADYNLQVLRTIRSLAEKAQ